MALLVALLALPPVLLSPARPLWPSGTVLKALAGRYPQSAAVARMKTVYAAYADRADCLAPLRQWIPAQTGVIGFAGNEDDPVGSLWKPLGTHRVMDMLPSSPRPGNAPSFVVASEDGLLTRYGQTVQDWARERHAQIVGREKITIKVHRGAENWYVLRLPETGQRQSP